MTPAHGPLRMSGRAEPSRAGPLRRTSGPLFAICAEQLKLTKPQHHPEDAQRGGGPVNTAGHGMSPGTGLRVQTFVPGPVFKPDLHRQSRPGPARTGTPPDASVKAAEKSQSAGLPEPVLGSSSPVRSSPSCTGTVSSAAASDSPRLLPGAVADPRAPTPVCHCGAGLSLSLLLRQLVHHSPQARSPGSRRAHAPHVPGSGVRWRDLDEDKRTETGGGDRKQVSINGKDK